MGWCVHGYTALGLVAAGLIAVLLVQGGASSFRWCFLLMAVATIVDSTDGYLARKVRIKEVVPSFDGRRLDDLVDFLTYTFLPLLLIWRAGILPPGQEAWLFLPLLASAYGFCQVQAKTDDGYFLGFPSLWNVVALYLYMLPLGPRLSLGNRDRAGRPDLRADPPPLPLATGPAQSRGHAPGHPLGDSVRLADLDAPPRAKQHVRRDHDAMGVDLAFLPRVLPGRLVGDQRRVLAEAELKRV